MTESMVPVSHVCLVTLSSKGLHNTIYFIATPVMPADCGQTTSVFPGLRFHYNTSPKLARYISHCMRHGPRNAPLLQLYVDRGVQILMNAPL